MTRPRSSSDKENLSLSKQLEVKEKELDALRREYKEAELSIERKEEEKVELRGPGTELLTEMNKLRKQISTLETKLEMQNRNLRSENQNRDAFKIIDSLQQASKKIEIETLAIVNIMDKDLPKEEAHLKEAKKALADARKELASEEGFFQDDKKVRALQWEVADAERKVMRIEEDIKILEKRLVTYQENIGKLDSEMNKSIKAAKENPEIRRRIELDGTVGRMDNPDVQKDLAERLKKSTTLSDSDFQRSSGEAKKTEEELNKARSQLEVKSSTFNSMYGKKSGIEDAIDKDISFLRDRIKKIKEVEIPHKVKEIDALKVMMDRDKQNVQVRGISDQVPAHKEQAAKEKGKKAAAEKVERQQEKSGTTFKAR